MKSPSRKVVRQREALSQTDIDRLLAVIEPAAVRNPWDDLGVQVRNRLLIEFLYGLGVRPGEALGINIERHLDFSRNCVVIEPRAADPGDPRSRLPPVTARHRHRLRQLPLAGGQIEMIRSYINDYRCNIPNTQTHPFLFVSHRDGRPLNSRDVSRAFEQIRKQVPDMAPKLTTLALRHAWNEAFSRLCDANQIAPEREALMRCSLMGWPSKSPMAEIYKIRYIK